MEGDGSDNENDFFNPEEEVAISPSDKVYKINLSLRILYQK